MGFWVFWRAFALSWSGRLCSPPRSRQIDGIIRNLRSGAKESFWTQYDPIRGTEIVDLVEKSVESVHFLEGKLVESQSLRHMDVKKSRAWLLEP